MHPPHPTGAQARDIGSCTCKEQQELRPLTNRPADRGATAGGKSLRSPTTSDSHTNARAPRLARQQAPPAASRHQPPENLFKRNAAGTSRRVWRGARAHTTAAAGSRPPRHLITPTRALSAFLAVALPPPTLCSIFFLLGAGGTGGRSLPDLARSPVLPCMHAPGTLAQSSGRITGACWRALYSRRSPRWHCGPALCRTSPASCLAWYPGLFLGQHNLFDRTPSTSSEHRRARTKKN